MTVHQFDREFLFVMPYMTPTATKLVRESNEGIAELSVFNTNNEYLVTSGVNLRKVGIEPDTVTGQPFNTIAFPTQLTGLMIAVLKRTMLLGQYVNLMISWRGQSHHLHTHPVYSGLKGIILGCVFVFETMAPESVELQIDYVNGMRFTQIPHPFPRQSRPSSTLERDGQSLTSSLDADVSHLQSSSPPEQQQEPASPCLLPLPLELVSPPQQQEQQEQQQPS